MGGPQAHQAHLAPQGPLAPQAYIVKAQWQPGQEFVPSRIEYLSPHMAMERRRLEAFRNLTNRNLQLPIVQEFVPSQRKTRSTKENCLETDIPPSRGPDDSDDDRESKRME